jgi:uncharacterized protein related to proFAR isomerase
MRVIPAVSISQGGVLVVDEGEYRFLKGKEGKPVELAKELRFSHEIVFILDIDGIERNSPDLNLIRRMSGLVELWVDAGTLTSNGAMDMLVAGASKVVMGTKSILGMVHLGRAVELSENIIFSVDYDRGVLAAEPAMAEMATELLLNSALEMNVRTALLFDLGGVRDRSQPPLDILRAMVRKFDEVYVAGFVKHETLGSLGGLGLAGVVMDFRSVR